MASYSSLASGLVWHSLLKFCVYFYGFLYKWYGSIKEKARAGTVKAVSILAFAVNQDLIHPQRCFRNPEADGISHLHRHPPPPPDKAWCTDAV